MEWVMEAASEIYDQFLRLNLWWLLVIALAIACVRNVDLLRQYWAAQRSFANASINGLFSRKILDLPGVEIERFFVLSIKVFWVFAKYLVPAALLLVVIDIVFGLR